SFPVDAMTHRALPLAVEQRLAARRVTDAAEHAWRRAGAQRRHVADVGDDGGGLLIGEVVRRHRRAGDAGLDHFDEIGVGGRAAELSASEIDAGDAVAGLAVAARAVRLE